MMLAMWSPGPMELIVCLFVALLFFGRRLPETGRSLGLGIKEFKKGLADGAPEAESDEAVAAATEGQGKVIDGQAIESPRPAGDSTDA